MSRKFQKLTLQYAFLKIEKEDIEEICENKEKELQEYMRTHHPEIYENKKEETPKSKESSSNKDDNEEQSKENKEEENTNPEQEVEYDDVSERIPKNKDLKILYRKIVAKTHPDKVGSEKHAELFNSAARAYEENNLARLLEIAGLLNIELLELSPEAIKLLEENIKTISLKINSLKQSAAWAWHNADTEEQKKRIVNFILESRK